MRKAFARAGIAVAVLGLGLAGGMARGDSLVVQWNTGLGADQNYYQRVDTGNSSTLTFSQAEADAAAKTLTVGTTTYQGELAILDPNYTDAFDFIEQNVMYPTLGGASQNEVYWVGASSPDGNAPPNNKWTWINGVAVPDTVVNTWNIDHYEGAGAEGIGYYRDNSQLWDYIASDSDKLAYGYVVEFVPNASVAPLPSAGLAALLLLGGLWGAKLVRRRKMIGA